MAKRDAEQYAADGHRGYRESDRYDPEAREERILAVGRTAGLCYQAVEMLIREDSDFSKLDFPRTMSEDEKEFAFLSMQKLYLSGRLKDDLGFRAGNEKMHRLLGHMEPWYAETMERVVEATLQEKGVHDEGSVRGRYFFRASDLPQDLPEDLRSDLASALFAGGDISRRNAFLSDEDAGLLRCLVARGESWGNAGPTAGGSEYSGAGGRGYVVEDGRVVSFGNVSGDDSLMEFDNRAAEEIAVLNYQRFVERRLVVNLEVLSKRTDVVFERSELGHLGPEKREDLRLLAGYGLSQLCEGYKEALFWDSVASVMPHQGSFLGAEKRQELMEQLADVEARYSASDYWRLDEKSYPFAEPSIGYRSDLYGKDRFDLGYRLKFGSYDDYLDGMGYRNLGYTTRFEENNVESYLVARNDWKGGFDVGVAVFRLQDYYSAVRELVASYEERDEVLLELFYQDGAKPIPYQVEDLMAEKFPILWIPKEHLDHLAPEEFLGPPSGNPGEDQIRQGRLDALNMLRDRIEEVGSLGQLYQGALALSGLGSEVSHQLQSGVGV